MKLPVQQLEDAVEFALNEVCPELKHLSKGSVTKHRSSENEAVKGPCGPEYQCVAPEKVFWELFRQQKQKSTSQDGNKLKVRKDRKQAASQDGIKPKRQVVVESDFGLRRKVTLSELGTLVSNAIADWPERQRLIAFCGVNGSGRLLFNTVQTVSQWRAQGLVDCATCGKFVKSAGSGLIWHVKRAHATLLDHDLAFQASHASSLALVVYSTAQVPSSSKAESPEPPPAAPITAEARFFAASKDGDCDELRRMVEQGLCDPLEASDRHGSDALMWAAGEGHLECCRYLVLECGVDPASPPKSHARRARRGYAGRLAMHWAARNGHLQVVDWLVTETNCEPDLETGDGTTPLALAAYQGHLGVCRYLIQCGADPHRVNSYGCSAAMWAAQGVGSLAVLRLLVEEAGVDLERLNDNGQGCLHKAAQRGHLSVAKWLIEEAGLCSKVHFLPNASERSVPSQLAVYGGHDDMARYLEDIEQRFVDSA